MSLFGSGRREGLLAVLILLLLSIVCHGAGLFLDMPRDPDPMSWSGTATESVTNHASLLPSIQAAGRVVQAGELPLWNPTSRFGEPFATSGAPVLYPPYWLLMMDGGENLLDLLLCLHTFLAAMCMYRFCRVKPISRYVSFLAGALYGLGWFFHAQLDRLPEAAAAAILPLALEFTWRLLLSGHRFVYAGLLSVVVALMFTTGGTATAVLGLCVCVAMFVHGISALDRDNRRLAVQGAAVSTLFAALLTAPLWVHAFSHAAVLSTPPAVAHSTAAHLQLSGLLATLGPSTFGGLKDSVPEVLRMINPGADPLELALFPGSLVLFLGVLGLLRPKRTAIGLFWIPVGGIGLLLSIDSPITESLGRLSFWPPIGPGVTLLLVNLAFVMLAAVALENFFEAPQARTIAVPIAAGVTFVFGGALFFVGFLYPDAGRALIRELTGAETLADVQQALNHLRFAFLPTILFSASIAGLFLAWRKLGLPRFKFLLATIVVADLLLVTILHTPRAGAGSGSSCLTARIPESAGRAILAGRDHVGAIPPLREAGIPAIATIAPGILARTADFLQTVDGSMVTVGNRSRVLPLSATPLVTDELLDLAGVGIAITTEPHTPRGFVPLAPAPAAESARDRRAHFHFRVKPPRRVRVLFQVVHADSAETARGLLREYAQHLDETVILEGKATGFVCKRPARPPKVTFLRDGANTVQLRADMGQGRGYLLLADAYAPGWRAEIDGEPLEILPADVALRAVAVPEGLHEVTFVYDPPMWRIGLPIASLGLALLLAFWFQIWRTARRLARAVRARDGTSA